MELTNEEFQRRLFQRVQMDTRTRYKLPIPRQQAEAMLTQCYIGEMKKRGIAVDFNTQLDDLARDKIAKVAKWLTGDFKIGLLLYGTVGSGKSTIANAMCELLAIVRNAERKGVHRISAIELVGLKTSKDIAKSEDNEYRFNIFKTCEMLFIDDLGTESVTIKNWGNNLTPMIDLLYHRYDKQLFTILTSNFDNDSIRALYDNRIADRFAEMFDTISYTNQSYRK